jgi:hypothetical protein
VVVTERVVTVVVAVDAGAEVRPVSAVVEAAWVEPPHPAKTSGSATIAARTMWEGPTPLRPDDIAISVPQPGAAADATIDYQHSADAAH